MSMLCASVYKPAPWISLACFAIRSSLVEMSSELGDSVIFSLQRGCFSARSLARPGPLERVPRRRRYYCALRPLDTRRARFPSPHRSYLPTERRDSIPGSWTTLANVPCSPIPVGVARSEPQQPAFPDTHLASLLPSTNGTASAPTDTDLRDSISRPTRPLSTLRDHGRP